MEKQRRAGGCPDPEKRYRSSNFPQPRSPPPPPTLPSRPQSSDPPSRLRSAESPGPREDPALGGAFLGRMGRGLERGDRVGRGPQISGARGGGGSRCSSGLCQKEPHRCSIGFGGLKPSCFNVNESKFRIDSSAAGEWGGIQGYPLFKKCGYFPPFPNPPPGGPPAQARARIAEAGMPISFPLHGEEKQRNRRSSEVNPI